MKRTEAAAKPFIKWAGGKGQLLSQLDEHLPQQLDGRPFTYVEPFVGGGAMLFHMLKKHPEIRRAVINDINAHLVTAYRVVKEHPHELIERLSTLERQYNALDSEEAKKAFYLGGMFILGFLVSHFLVPSCHHNVKMPRMHPVFVNGCLDMESIKCPKMQEKLATADVDANGCITAEEFRAVKHAMRREMRENKMED